MALLYREDEHVLCRHTLPSSGQTDYCTPCYEYNNFTSASSAAGTLEQPSLSQDSKCVLHLKIALMLSTLSPL